MNRDRRKQIDSIGEAVDKIKKEIDSKAADEQTGEAGGEDELKALEANWRTRLQDVKEEVETVKDEEQEYYDNMPEGLQGGDRGTAAEDAVNYLQEAEDHLEEIVDAEEVGTLTRLFNEKYDSLSSLLQDASA